MSHVALRICAAVSLSVAGYVAASPGTYQVNATLSHEGIPFASPSVVVQANSTVSLAVDGSGWYAMDITVHPRSDGTLEVQSTLTSEHGDMAPHLQLQPGGTASMRVGALELMLTVEAADS